MRFATHKDSLSHREGAEVGPADVGLVVALPASILVLCGCLYHLLHHSLLASTDFGPYGLVYSGYATLVPPFAFCGAYAFSLGRNGLWALAVGIALGGVAIVNFRGSYYWPGTFRMAHTGTLHTVLPVTIGLAGGAAIRWQSRAGGRLALARKTSWPIAIAALGWSWIDSTRDIGMESPLPYSLHYSLTVIDASALLVALLCVFAER